MVWKLNLVKRLLVFAAAVLASLSAYSLAFADELVDDGVEFEEQVSDFPADVTPDPVPASPAVLAEDQDQEPSLDQDILNAIIDANYNLSVIQGQLDDFSASFEKFTKSYYESSAAPAASVKSSSDSAYIDLIQANNENTMKLLISIFLCTGVVIGFFILDKALR